ncbi:MAG: hypothetical protein ACFCBW_02030, partial [Candidatus Competibacterales bacterium]
MKVFTLVLLRISLALLMVTWGVDKLVDLNHAQTVLNRFYLDPVIEMVGNEDAIRVTQGETEDSQGEVIYFDTLTEPQLLQILGGLQILLGVLVLFGLLKVLVYPILILITGATAVARWPSIVAPGGLYLNDFAGTSYNHKSQFYTKL